MKKTVNLWKGGVLLLFSAVGIVASADAAVTTYTSAAQFNSALTASYTDNFNDESGSTINTPLTISGGTPLFNAQASGAGSSVFYLVKGRDSTGVGLSSAYNAEQIIITSLSANVTAVGGYFYLTETSGSVQTGNFHVSVDDGSSTTLTATSSGPVFFGFTKSSVSDFTKLTLYNDSSGEDRYISFDDLTIGTITAVPEPSTWMAIGFLGLTLAGRFGRAIWIRNRPR